MKTNPKSSLRPAALAAATLALAATSAFAQTTLLTDSFDTVVNNQAGTFNANIADSQAGSLATTTYDVQGSDWRAQHGTTNLTISNAPAFYGTADVGNVSLNNDFATQANAANQPLQISFNIVDVANVNADDTAWVQFNVGNSAHADIQGGTVGLGMLFRGNQGTQTFSGGPPIDAGTYADGDLVTITLSGAGGVGSAFNGNGSVATVKVGSGAALTYTLAQQTNAYVTFGGFEPNYGQVVGNFDNLSVSLVSTADPYLAWINATWPTLSDKTPTADPDNDGIDNIVEYVLQGGDPSVSTTGILPNLNASGTDFVFTFSRRTAATGTVQTFESSTNLSDWATRPPLAIPAAAGTYGEVVVGPATGTPPNEVQAITITVAKGAETKLFGRLQVVK